MKKLLLLFILAVTANLKSFCYVERGCSFSVEGAEPESKKYYFNINKPEGFDASEYQFMIWKILKTRGYELVPISEADIVIQLNFIGREKNVEGHENVLVGEKTTEAFGQTIHVPVYDNRSTGHYTDKYITLDIKALPKGINENSIPIWKMTMDWSFNNSKEDFIYGIDLIWLQEGYHYINYRIETKKGKPYVTKLRDGKEKMTDEQTKEFAERIQYIKSKVDATEYNKQLNK